MDSYPPPIRSNVSTTSKEDDDTNGRTTASGFTPRQSIRYVSDPVQSVCGSFFFDSDSGLPSRRALHTVPSFVRGNVVRDGGRGCIQESSSGPVVREVDSQSDDNDEEEEDLHQPRQSSWNILQEGVSGNQDQLIDSSGESDTTGRTESLSESEQAVICEDDGKTGKNDSLSDTSDNEVDEDEGSAEHYRLPPRSEQALVIRERPALEPPEENKLFVLETKLKTPALKKRTKVRSSARQIIPQERQSSRERKKQALVKPPTQRYNGYKHTFITVLDEHRFLILYTLLTRNTDAKIIIFFSTVKSTQYYTKLLDRLKFDVRAIHNCQSKSALLSECLQFSKQKTGILCLSDSQAKDLTVPMSATWSIQFEPPESPTEYIFRVERISSEKSHAVGRALLFLTPQQYGFFRYFKAAKVKVSEYEIRKISNVQRDLIKLMRKDGKLRKYGLSAYHDYRKSYANHEYRDIFNIYSLDLNKVALAFGFAEPPSKDEDGRGVIPREERRWKPSKTKKGKDGTTRDKKSWKSTNRHAIGRERKTMIRPS